MKALVVYDSVFGNTEQIARAIGEALGAEVLPVGGAQAGAPEGFIVVASEGPLQEGELERAAAWARQIAAR